MMKIAIFFAAASIVLHWITKDGGYLFFAVQFICVVMIIHDRNKKNDAENTGPVQ